MMNPLVTIAISAYNVDNYISAALESIISQSYTNLDILCIDDASTDMTWEKMQESAKRDKRIRLMRNDRNMGLSHNRNVSLEKARGEWILMADGDDLMHQTLIEKAIICAEDNNADMVMWDYKEFYGNDNPDLNNIPEIGRLTFPANDKVAMLKAMSFTWTRLIKTSVLRNLDISFPLGRIKQDIPAHWKEIIEIDDIAILNEKYSFYRQRRGATSRRKDKSILDWIYNLNLVEQYLVNSQNQQAYLDVLHRQQLDAFLLSNRVIMPSLRPYLKDEFNKKMSGDFKMFYEQEFQRASFATRVNMRSLSGAICSQLLFTLFCMACNIKNTIVNS